jgi:hypothetical protein
MRKTIFAALFTLAPALFASSAKADVLDFSYVMSTGSVISGTMDGTLLTDSNDFDVSSFGSLFVNSVAVTVPFLIESTDYAILDETTPAEVSLNGSYMNLAVESYTDDLVFAVNDATSAILDGGYAGASPGYGGDNSLEPYVQSNWTASIAPAPVPEPSSLLLMLAPLALTALVVTSRRSGRRSV